METQNGFTQEFELATNEKGQVFAKMYLGANQAQANASLFELMEACAAIKFNAPQMDHLIDEDHVTVFEELYFMVRDCLKPIITAPLYSVPDVTLEVEITTDQQDEKRDNIVSIFEQVQELRKAGRNDEADELSKKATELFNS